MVSKTLRTHQKNLSHTTSSPGFFKCRALGVALALTMGGPALAARALAADPKPSDALKEEARKVLGGGAGDAARDKDKSKKDGGDAKSTRWCIAIMSMRDETRHEAAPIALEQVRTKGRLPEAYVDVRASATVIAVGSYDGPDDPQAQEDLKRVRAIEVEGLTPYAFAFLCPPEARDQAGSVPEYNLTRAREMYGDKAIQTLQVAVYGREDLKNPTEKDLAEVRTKAEEYCVQLRREGELAFYYHGPRRSMVTIGVFDLTDYDPQLPSYNSPRLQEVRKRHPHNLYNGAAIREKRPGQKEGRLQTSTLVMIPEDTGEKSGGGKAPAQETPKLAPPR